MKLYIYEVGFYGADGDPDDQDTLYLVCAASFENAVDLVANFHSHLTRKTWLADFSYQLGTALSSADEESILRGPYYAAAVNPGWPAWYRE